jgi:hypothetical protein
MMLEHSVVDVSMQPRVRCVQYLMVTLQLTLAAARANAARDSSAACMSRSGARGWLAEVLLRGTVKCISSESFKKCVLWRW